MNALAEGAYFDKGSVTKSIQKLEESGYVEVEVSSEDRRVKKLYTTAKTQEIILKLYAIRQERWNYLSQDLSAQEKQAFIDMTMNRSIHNFEVSVTPDDYILTLSTCTDSNERLVVHAKRIS